MDLYGLRVCLTLVSCSATWGLLDKDDDLIHELLDNE